MTSLFSIKERTAQATGWWRNAIAFTCGVCATGALPPLFLFPLLIPAFTGLLWLVEGASHSRRAFWDGWWFGFGHFTTGLYWMCIALLTDPEKFAWLIPFTLIGLNGLFALFPAIAMMFFYHLRSRIPLWQPIAFACCWTLIEYARGHILTGLPWNLAGYTWAFSNAASQSAAFIGIYGLTFVTVLIACIPSVMPVGRKGTLTIVVAWRCFTGMIAGGLYRLHLADSEPEKFVPNVKLRLVQANIEQKNKWLPQNQIHALEQQLQLSLRPGYQDITHIIWPETAVPFVLTEANPLMRSLRQVAPPGGALLVGALRAEGEEDNFRLWNSLAVIARQGVIAWYDKHHLVPFGEFVPLRGILPIDKITPGMIDFSRGSGASTLTVSGAPPVSPLICYEAIFPGEVINKNSPPAWLLNITNDAWFGASTGPYQHFHMSRFRAIEQGLQLVRAANTGISAVIDGYGRVVASLPLNRVGTVDVGLPKPAMVGTIYSSASQKCFLLLILMLSLLTIWYKSKPFFKKQGLQS